MRSKPNKPKGFKYVKTKSLIRYQWSNGSWDKGELLDEDTFQISYAATALHYGQSAFEGLKAFKWEDGTINVFRPGENAKRMRHSCQRLLMPEVTDEMFVEAIEKVISDNKDFVPNPGEGALYIRPFIFGCGETIGVAPSDKYQFVVMVVPAGDYYSSGINGVKAVIWDEFDRAAPFGLGNIKAAGNYAAGLQPMVKAKQSGFDIVLYLDSKTRTLIEEFGTSNFIAIDESGTYVTPDSTTILKSITNISLMQLCQSMGITVDKRKVKYSELASFKEIGACGTAVVITPVAEIHHSGNTIWTSEPGSDRLNSLKQRYQQIQQGQIEDKFSWMHRV